jgi:TATA-box binding protein (TBP) (component of TFIID and TFIIIB)
MKLMTYRLIHAEKRMMYNISGKQGILLVFENGKKIIIGTRKAEEISKILKKP